MVERARVVPLVLAAGTSSRFGSPKLLARLGDRPVLWHVLAALDGLGLARPVVVVGHEAEAIRAAVGAEVASWVVNPRPEDGLSGSLRTGLRAVDAAAESVLILLGDQPAVRSATIEALLGAPIGPATVAVVPSYDRGGGANPVLLRREGFRLVGEATGDRGLGPILDAATDRVARVPVTGDNPDVDTPADLAAAAWADRVRANREQVDRFREVPDGPDFYGPVSTMFVADPRRTDDPALEALLGLVRPGERWLDIGAGAGRFALPLALALGPDGLVVAVDPSDSMRAALTAAAAEHGLASVRVVAGRWPPEDLAGFETDVAFIAHVGYDVEAIGPFVDAMEAVARRRCVALLMERAPASQAGVFWPVVHGEARVELPALPEFLALLEARGRVPTVRRIDLPPRTFAGRDQLVAQVRRQLWVAPGGEKDRLAMAELDRLAVPVGDGLTLRGAGPLVAGLVDWAPRPD